MPTAKQIDALRKAAADAYEAWAQAAAKLDEALAAEPQPEAEGDPEGATA